MKIKKRIFSLALAGTMALGLMPGMTMTALADGDTSYTLTIPSTLTVANSGWNATDGISATGTLASGKKLTVTASSANSWAIKSGDNSVGYTLTTAEGGSQTTSWEFTTLDGTAKPMGIIVENYDNKPAGTYTDTVTFTAAVENAGIPVSSVTINNAPTEALFVNSTGTLTATVCPMTRRIRPSHGRAITQTMLRLMPLQENIQ